jgi:hypothetical protein
MFSAQAGQIANALKAAGLRPDAAHKIAAILGNGVQTIVRTNPESVDLTPQSLRYVTPAARKYELQGLDFRQGDPDFRPYQQEASEERPKAQQASSVRSDPAPQKTQATYRVAGGKFTEARGTGEAVQVDVRVAGNGRVALLDPQSNTIIGKNIRCETDDSGLRFFIEETGTELVWKLQLGSFLSSFLSSQSTEIEVVTGVTLGAAGLEIRKRTIRVLAATEEYPGQPIATTSCST